LYWFWCNFKFCFTDFVLKLEKKKYTKKSVESIHKKPKKIFVKSQSNKICDFVQISNATEPIDMWEPKRYEVVMIEHKEKSQFGLFLGAVGE